MRSGDGNTPAMAAAEGAAKICISGDVAARVAKLRGLVGGRLQMLRSAVVDRTHHSRGRGEHTTREAQVLLDVMSVSYMPVIWQLHCMTQRAKRRCSLLSVLVSYMSVICQLR